MPKRNPRPYGAGTYTEAGRRAFIVSALRQKSRRWKPVYEAQKDACVGKRVNAATGRMALHYKCSACGGEYPSNKIDVDHIEPAVPLSGWDGFDGFIERLFCEKKGLAVLCKACHKTKTDAENAQRRANKKP